MACRRIQKLKEMIVILVGVVIALSILLILVSNNINDSKYCEMFTENSDYDKEFNRFIKMNNIQQKTYLEMSRDQKIAKYGNF